MKYLIILAIGVILGFIFTRSKKRNLISEQGEEKEWNKRKIMELLHTKHSVTNNDVENFLGVSDASATRYLDELEKEGKLRQVGEVGRGVQYERL